MRYKAAPGDPGSFYAIGDASGGHDAVHPQLGTLDDFRRLVASLSRSRHGDRARYRSPMLARSSVAQAASRMVQEAPRRHDQVCRKSAEKIRGHRQSRTSASDDRVALWTALRDVFLFWVDQGVEIFRVDNPHTKPLPFWEWLIAEVHSRNSNVIFLSEAFTRPKVMKALAKLGFSQSYTYFTWRTTKAELQEYLSELTRHPERDYFRPNFFVTTPDILPVQLQTGETWLFKARAALAATLSSNYGIYNGYELIEHEPIPGKEEYLNSEKYEIRTRDWHKAGNIADYLGRLNRMRRDNPRASADIEPALPGHPGRPSHRLHQDIGRRHQCGGSGYRSVSAGASVLAAFRRCASRHRRAGSGDRKSRHRRAPYSRMGRRPSVDRPAERSRNAVPLSGLIMNIAPTFVSDVSQS